MGTGSNFIRVLYFLHTSLCLSGTVRSKMADFEEDPAADFLAREQDDLAELGEDFGGEQPPANVSF